MDTIKFLHLGDIHLNMRTHGRFDPVTRIHSRTQDILNSLTFLIKAGLERDMDALVIAGDICHTWSMEPVYIAKLAQALQPVAQEKIPIIMIPGNHDLPNSAQGISLLQALGEFTYKYLFILKNPGIWVIETKKRLPLTILAVPWLLPSQYPDLEAGYVETIQALIQKRVDGIPSIFLGHFGIEGASYEGTERKLSMPGRTEPVIPRHLFQFKKSPGIQYVAMGHIHKYQVLGVPRGIGVGASPPIVYSGTLERVTFGERNDLKGGVFVTLRGTDFGEFDFIESPARAFHQFCFTMEGVDSLEEIETALLRYNVEGAIVKIEILTDRIMAVRGMLSSIFQLFKKRGAHFISHIEITPLHRDTEHRAVTVTLEDTVETQVERYTTGHPKYEPLQTELLTATRQLAR
jgi:exonuclease SbcD